MGCTLKSCKSWCLHTCTAKARARLSVSWCPAVCCLAGDHLHRMGGSAGPPSLAAHTPVSLPLGPRRELCVQNVCVYVAMYRGAACWGGRCTALPARPWAGTQVWALKQKPPQEKNLRTVWKWPAFLARRQTTARGLASLQRLKNPGRLRICWRKTRHSGEGVRHFRLGCLTPEDTAIEKYASLAVGHCRGGQAKSEMCPYLYRRAILKCFLPLLSHMSFLFSTVVNRE